MTDHFIARRHPTSWTSEGSGPTVVLLHGLGGDRQFWANEIMDLSRGSHVIAVDLRGSGDSPTTNGGHAISDLADDVFGVLDDAGVDAADVVGFSMGGLVAQSMAVRQPHRVNRMVLASTYAVMNPQARMFLDAVRDVVIAENSLRAVYPLICPWLFSPDFLREPANAGWLEAVDDVDELPEGWLAQYRAQRDFDGRADLNRITAPTVILSGDADRLVDASDVSILADGIAGATIKFFRGSGHLINLEQYGRFLSEIEAFLEADS